MHPRHKITLWLDSAPSWVFALYAISCSFCVYFFMFAFRKPYLSASYEDQVLLFGSLHLKTIYVISQIFGYGLAKFIGVKFCSEINHSKRALALILLIMAAETAWLGFALLPLPLKPLALFLNGLPLGMIWGLVVSYLEGRALSELLLAGLSCSFILATGVMKDIGALLLRSFLVPVYWIPALTGLLFLPFFGLSVWFLQLLPQPTLEDEVLRVKRTPMSAQDRYAFVRSFLFGLLLLLISYFFITAYRDFRDNYGIEILRELGYADRMAAFSRTELPIAFAVTGLLALLNLIRDNRLGLIGAYLLMSFGTVIMGGATLLFETGSISGMVWMGLVGFGSYLAYVPYGSVLFDRTIAYSRVTGTAVFAIYLADAFGYTGSIGIQLYKDFGRGSLSNLAFFKEFTYFTSLLGTALLLASCLYFLKKRRQSLETHRR